MVSSHTGHLKDIIDTFNSVLEGGDPPAGYPSKPDRKVRKKLHNPHPALTSY